MAAKIHGRWTKDGCDVKGCLYIIYLSDLSDNAPLLSSVSSDDLIDTLTQSGSQQSVISRIPLTPSLSLSFSIYLSHTHTHARKQTHTHTSVENILMFEIYIILGHAFCCCNRNLDLIEVLKHQLGPFFWSLANYDDTMTRRRNPINRLIWRSRCHQLMWFLRLLLLSLMQWSFYTKSMLTTKPVIIFASLASQGSTSSDKISMIFDVYKDI